jgi:hypothetical protein
VDAPRVYYHSITNGDCKSLFQTACFAMRSRFTVMFIVNRVG